MKFKEVTWYSKLLALALFVVLPFLGFYAGMRYQEVVAPTKEEAVVKTGTSSAAPKDRVDDNNNTTKISIETNQITLKATYENGELEYSGTVWLPTPCHQLTDQTRVLESYPEQVKIQLVIDPPPSDTYCIALVTRKDFSNQLQVSENAKISVYLNDEKLK